MDKVTLGFLSDLLYLKGIINYEEYEAIQHAKNVHDLEDILERMLTDGFNQFKRGQSRFELTAD